MGILLGHEENYRRMKPDILHCWVPGILINKGPDSGTAGLSRGKKLVTNSLGSAIGTADT